MTSMPALLPAANVPFSRAGLVLGFLYPTNGLGLDLQLSEPADKQAEPSRQAASTADEQPWIFNLDTGLANYSPNPERWIYTLGNAEPFDSAESGQPASARILTDPARVREVVIVPRSCQPIPVLYRQGLCPANRNVRFVARVVEMDDSLLAELSQLGAPLAEKVYAQFYRPDKSSAPLCLAIDTPATELSLHTSATNEPQTPKVLTIASEFFLEDASTGAMLEFTDDDLLDWFLPAVKDNTMSLNGHFFPDRWLARIVGFDGHMFVFKNGPVEVSISPIGAISVYTLADVNSNLATARGLLERFTKRLTTGLQEVRETRFGQTVLPRTTFLTDSAWQISFGKLLDGESFGEALRASKRFKYTRSETQSSSGSDKSPHLEAVLQPFLCPIDINVDLTAALAWFGSAKHNLHVLPITKSLFDTIGLPNWTTHDPKDVGMDHLVYARTHPRVSVCIQFKSHAEILADDFYDTVMAQRVQSSAYNADHYLILLYGNPLSTASQRVTRRQNTSEGELVAGRFAELKRRFERSSFRADTDVVQPENLAQIIVRHGIALPATSEAIAQ